jgi:hypothetical protein
LILPQLTPNEGADLASASPPHGFRPLKAKPEDVRWLTRTPGFFNQHGTTTAQQNGIRYEIAVHAHFTKLWSSDYHVQPILSFHEGTAKRRRIVVPDGILLRDGKPAVVFEVKSQHMPEAWWQLRKLYAPVVEAYWPHPVMLCEVVKSFDPSIGFPEPVKLCNSVEQVLDERPVPFKVLIWRK